MQAKMFRVDLQPGNDDDDSYFKRFTFKVKRNLYSPCDMQHNFFKKVSLNGYYHL